MKRSLLKLLHLADLHLDSRFAAVSQNESAKRRAELRNVFKNALELAKNEGCSVVLISGDLFDCEYYTKDTLDFLRGAFASMPDIRFFISPGNHDPYNSSSPYRLGVFTDNVTVFDSENVTGVTLDGLDLTVYGYAFTSAVYTKDPLSGFSLDGKTRYNVLCAHTELDALASPYAPISSVRLSEIGFDYAALGHIHTSAEIRRLKNTVYAYSGCIAGRDHSEYGEKGGIIVTFDENGTKAERVRLCPWVYCSESADVSGARSEEAILEMLKAALSKKSGDIEYIVRLRLTGSIEIDLDTVSLTKALAPFGVSEIRNDTVGLCGMEALEKDYSLKGEFFKLLKDGLVSEDAEKRRITRLALKYGLAALDGAELDVQGEGE